MTLEVSYTNVEQHNNTDAQFEKRRKNNGKGERIKKQEQLKS